MAQKNVNLDIILNGRIGSGVQSLTDRITQIGGLIDRVSSKVAEWEEESVGVYRDYETYMLMAKAAMTDDYKSVNQLEKAYNAMWAQSQIWASTTIFHTNDVGKALYEAAQAGWDFNKMTEGIPAAMLLAQAGNLDLSSGLDYLIKVLNGTGEAFENSDRLADEWVMTAHASATNVSELGEAMERMGATARFGDSTAELLALLGVLADTGTVGQQAGTLLRNSMIRLVAPTTNAHNAMKLLGADAEELEEALRDENVTKAAKTLQGVGFSAYDSQGKLKPVITIFRELKTTLNGLNEEAQNEILSAIFPTRTITGAKSILESLDKLDELYTKITNSEGTAQSSADIMMSGLMGAQERFFSKWEEFERKFGESASGPLETLYELGGRFIDKLNELDEPTMSSLVGGLTTLAGLGPVMLGGTGIIKAVELLGWKGTLLLGAAVGASALYGYISKLNEINFKENFGTMALDLDELGQHVDSLKTKFSAQQEAIAVWEQALEEAESAYAEKSTLLSETLLTDVLTGKTLTQGEIDNINTYAKDLTKAVYDGMEQAKASDMSFLEVLFDDHENPDLEEVGNTAAQVVDKAYKGLYNEAYKIGEELRSKMTAALKDKNLNDEELEALQATIDRYDEIMAKIQSRMSAEAYEAQLYKMKSVSWDTADAYISENTEKMEAELESVNELYANKYAHFAVLYKEAIENGTEIETLDGTTRKVTEDDLNALFEAIETEKEATRQSVKDKYGTLNMEMFDALMKRSDYGEAWKLIRGATFNEEGGIDLTDMFAGMNSDQLAESNRRLSELWQNAKSIIDRLPSGFGDTEQGDRIAKLLESAGQAATEAAQWETNLWMSRVDRVPTQAEIESGVWTRQQMLAAKQAEIERYQAESEKMARRIEELQKQAEGPEGLFRRASSAKTELYGSFFLDHYTGGGLIDQKKALDLQIEEAMAELEKLQAEAEKDVEMPVVTSVDDSAVENWKAPTKYMTVRPLTVYADGGRADMPSIFGEAGPEWAIPEEHSQRTAELLRMAAQASGFSWGELLSRNGGLNGGRIINVNVGSYSPTIHASNAAGVEQKLIEDKKRLTEVIRRAVRNALEEKGLLDEVEVYA